jgi:hypothetical protein
MCYDCARSQRTDPNPDDDKESYKCPAGKRFYFDKTVIDDRPDDYEDFDCEYFKLMDGADAPDTGIKCSLCDSKKAQVGRLIDETIRVNGESVYIGLVQICRVCDHKLEKYCRRNGGDIAKAYRRALLEGIDRTYKFKADLTYYVESDRRRRRPLAYSVVAPAPAMTMNSEYIVVQPGESVHRDYKPLTYCVRKRRKDNLSLQYYVRLRYRTREKLQYCIETSPTMTAGLEYCPTQPGLIPGRIRQSVSYCVRKRRKDKQPLQFCVSTTAAFSASLSYTVGPMVPYEEL